MFPRPSRFVPTCLFSGVGARFSVPVRARFLALSRLFLSSAPEETCAGELGCPCCSIFGLRIGPRQPDQTRCYLVGLFLHLQGFGGPRHSILTPPIWTRRHSGLDRWPIQGMAMIRTAALQSGGTLFPSELLSAILHLALAPFYRGSRAFCVAA